QEDLDRVGVGWGDLVAPRGGIGFSRLMAFEVGRARQLLDRGAPLARDLGGRDGLAVAAFVAGGRSALDAIGRAGYDVLSQKPRPSRAGRAWTFLRVIAGPSGIRRAAR